MLISILSKITVGDFVLPVIQLLAGLGAFLIAVKIISDCMTQLANVGLKKLFQKVDKNRFIGVGIGALTSAVIHSSAVTTVMVIGFVNAGVMSLFQATTVIMGANIGTTFTALVASLQSFPFTKYVVVICFVGYVVMAIAKTEKGKDIGYFVAGLGLIFLALELMSSAFEPFTDPASEMGVAVQGFLQEINNPFLLVAIGVLLTVLLQSSTATTTILITMASNGLIIGGAAAGGISNGFLFVILGSNIGTCFTTILASFGTNTNAKRSALIHLLFNFFGSVLFFIMLIIWRNFTADTVNRWFENNPSLQVAIFHTLFNVVCTLLFLPFANVFVKIAEKIIPENEEDKKRSVMYIDDRFLATPSIAVQQAKKEAMHIGELVMETVDIAMKGFFDKDVSAEEKVAEKLSQVSSLNQTLIQYMVSVAGKSTTSLHSEGTLSSLYYVLGDLNRVGDLSTNITKYTHRIASGEVTFSDSVYPEIDEMYQTVRELYDVSVKCFLTKDKRLLKTVEKKEDEVDDKRRELIGKHIERLNNGECNPASNGVFVNLVGNLERMGDHITFIAESITKHPDDFVSAPKKK